MFVGFYDISTLVGYLIPNPLYKYAYTKYMIFGEIGYKNKFERAKAHLFAHSQIVLIIAM